jgi:hypothetical protein
MIKFQKDGKKMEGCMHKKIQMPDGLKSTINLIVEQEWNRQVSKFTYAIRRKWEPILLNQE